MNGVAKGVGFSW